ncbi:tRNA (N(6)-L-threonylcarbamoyladenosine(37)-C(2))-methylthiotransferase MtaB [bacterium]|nr:tRNA (N(6)-L-threonylcarbamoyladenosine(37)-C(2))-methylthiotransferase MtaB [bacterium]
MEGRAFVLPFYFREIFLFYRLMKRVSMHTLGCKLNYTETVTLREQFTGAGFDVVDFKDSSDVVLINTCSVTSKADAEARKLVRQALRRSPDAYVIVVGCYAQLRPEEIASIEGVDLVLGSKEKFHVMDYLNPALEKQGPRIIVDDVDDVTEFGPSAAADADERTRAFLKVQDGCDYSCSFCTIPMARGGSRSDSIARTVDHARHILGQGFREIVLSGVNVGDFGSGTDEDLYQLLLALNELDGDFRLRISSIEPNLLTDDIIRLTAESDRMCNHFHIPLQSGSDDVLRLMRRRYNTRRFRERIDAILTAVPDCGIGIDVIVGAPGETDERFEEGYRFLTDIPLEYLHVFTYSERPGTDALEIEEQVHPKQRAERNRMLRSLSQKKRRAFYQSQLGRTLDVLFEKVDDHGMIGGFTSNYVRVEIPYQPGMENSILPVRLDRIERGVVRGTLLSAPDTQTSYLSLPVIAVD